MENKKAGGGISPSPDLDQEYELRTSAPKKKWSGITPERRHPFYEKLEK